MLKTANQIRYWELDVKEMSKRIEKSLEERNITKERFAKRYLFINEETFNEYITGDRQIDPLLLYKISMILGVDIEYLLCIFNEPNHIGFIFESISHNNKIMMDYIKELENKFKQLEKQHMKLLMQWGKSDNPSFKFEELELYVPFWDKKEKEWCYFTKLNEEYNTGVKISISEVPYMQVFNYEEDRFYRNEVDEN